MGYILLLLGIPLSILAYLILFGGKECYHCGVRLEEKRKPIYASGKRVCEDCWVKNDKNEEK